MTEKIFRSIILTAVIVLIGCFIAVATVQYGYFANLQRQELSAELAAHAGAEVVVSGGMRGMQDVHAVGAAAQAGRGIAGAIIGKAIYEGALDLRAALEAAG